MAISQNIIYRFIDESKANRRFDKRHVLAGLFVFVMIAVIAFFGAKNIKSSLAKANMSEFKAGNIISDEVMSASKTMTEQQIQDFLNSKNSCNRTAPSQNSYSTTGSKTGNQYRYHVVNSKYVCLSQEKFIPETGLPDYDNTGKGETAAHIIWQAANDYKINPQVLIVLLEKEQGLITDDWPNSIQYRSATGYGCPDTAACDSKYYGFKNQVINAASLFRTVLDGGWTNYTVGNNSIYYNPNPNCGSSVVNIENLATAALYRYTPYQPNAAAIAAYTGTATCGAYGNRNFYIYFSEWFGSTQAVGAYPLDDVEGADKNIEDGEYTIYSAMDKNFAIDIAGASSDNNANVQVFSNNGTKAQRFKFTYNGKGFYKINTETTTGKVFDVEGASMKSGANVMQCVENGGTNQLWKIVKNSDGSYSIRSKNSGMYLNVDSGAIKDGVNINVSSKNDSASQKFYITKYVEPKKEEVKEVINDSDKTVEEGNYTIISKQNGSMVIDVNGASPDECANVQVYSNNGTKAQKFEFKYDGNGYYKIYTSTTTGKLLDVEGASKLSGANVFQHSENGGANQLWKAVKNSDGTYTFITKISGNVLDVLGGIVAQGTNVGVSVNHDGDNQRFYLKKL